MVRVSIAGANPRTRGLPGRRSLRRSPRERAPAGRLRARAARVPRDAPGAPGGHTAVEQLLRRLPALRLDPSSPAAPHGLVFRKPPELRVLWTPQAASPTTRRK